MKVVEKVKSCMVLDSLYLRHLSLRDKEAIKKHCEGVLSDKDVTKYGDPSSLDIETIDIYLASERFPSSYRASYKEETLTSWDKLILLSKKFVANYFSEMERSLKQIRAIHNFLGM